MAQQKEDAEFPLVKALREKIFKIPLLPQEHIINRFSEIDRILYPMAIRLCEDIPAVRNHFTNIVHKVASGNTLGKNYFNKQDNEDEKNAKKSLLKKSEIRILSESFALLRHAHSPAKFCKILETSGFMRGVMEEGIEIFLKAVENYRELVDGLESARTSHSLDYLIYERNLSDIATLLGVADDHQWIVNILDEIESQWTEYLDLREAIISPYYRLVYTISDKHSQTNSQTLDNFQNGVGGLLRAYKCYTPDRFAAFSLVAEQWIKQSVLLHIKTEVNFIKLPIANWHSFQKLEKVRLRLEQETNREVSMEQIAGESKTNIEKVKKIYENIKLAKVVNLNTPTYNEEERGEEASWGIENIASDPNAEERLTLETEYQTVRVVAQQFNDEETLIFALASGCLDLIDNSDLDPLDVEKERVRQKSLHHGLEIIFKE